MECGSEASAHAEADASALQTGQRAAPLSHSVGEGLGVRAKKSASVPHAANPSAVPLSAVFPSPVGRYGGLWSAEAKFPLTLKRALQHSRQVSARLPSPTLWERGWG
jgi:hypothetical protein